MIDVYNKLSENVIGACIAVHRELGPGLLESAYEACLELELRERGLEAQRQLELPVVYKTIRVDAGYRLDLVVNDLIILEIKSIERFEPIHTAQLLTYLKLTKMKLGLLLNFNVKMMVEGVKRVAHGELT